MPAARLWKFLLIIIALCYGFLGFFTILEARELTNEEVTHDGDTILFPIIYCRPTEYMIDGSVVAADTSDIDDCRSVRFLVAAVTVSLALSIVSTLAYLGVFGYVAIYHDSSTRQNKQMARGMSLVLVFVLIQAGLTLGALYQEKREYQKTIDVIVESDGWPYGDAKVYGSGWIMMSTIVIAFGLSLLLFLEFVFWISQSGTDGATTKDTSDVELHSSSGTTTTPVAPESTSSSAASPNNWTSV